MAEIIKAKARDYIAQTKDDWNYITPNDFYNNYYKKPDRSDQYILLDLRKKEIYNKYHIKGSKNIYWLDLLKTENLIYLDMVLLINTITTQIYLMLFIIVNIIGQNLNGNFQKENAK